MSAELRTRPLLLDLFCCAGGAAMGYHRAGFDVVGVDVVWQHNYPFRFIEENALALDPEWLKSFDAIHASPPCQSYTALARRTGTGGDWPRLIDPVRELLSDTGLPYVIENVAGAPLENPTVLCGTMFDDLRVLRHRLFESNIALMAPGPCRPHPLCHTTDKSKNHYGTTDEWTDYVSVNGGGNCTVAAARDAMGIEWMTKRELNEAIPPAYTEVLGRQLLTHIGNEAPTHDTRMV